MSSWSKDREFCIFPSGYSCISSTVFPPKTETQSGGVEYHEMYKMRQDQCYIAALEIDSTSDRSAIYWNCLAGCGGSTVNGKEYTEVECYFAAPLQAAGKKYMETLYNLGLQGGGTYNSETDDGWGRTEKSAKEYTKQECFI